MNDFKIGDHIQIQYNSGKTVRGILEEIRYDSQSLYIRLDDDMNEDDKRTASQNHNGLWYSPRIFCTVLDDNWQFPKAVAVEAKKGWQPDGFDADAYREFMRTL